MRAAVLVACAALVVSCSADDGEGAATTRAVDTSTTAVPDDVSTVEATGADWTQFGHDLGNSRLNAEEDQITSATADDLTEAWSLDGVVGVTSTPTVVDDVAYFGDWTGAVHAVDPATGGEVWTTQLGGSVIGSIPVDGDAVYASSGVTLYRLDRATGEVEWEAVTNDHPFAMISASPVVADGLVFQGVASGEVTFPQEDYTFIGTIGAWDAETGEELWRLDMTPGDETGGAGVGIWSTPAVDTERELLYVGTGNTYEEPTAPLSDSLIALDVATGEIAWSRQFTNPDVFSAGNPSGTDADIGAAPNLWSVGEQDLVGAGDKAGVYHALDRDTGEVVWETELTPGSYFGGVNGSSAFVDGSLIVSSNVGDAETNAPGNTAKVFALDAATGEIAWQVELEGMIFAPISTVPGVAFVATTNGLMLALDAATGDELWRHEAPNSVGAGPAVIDGRVLWGYGYALFEGVGDGGLIAWSLGGG